MQSCFFQLGENKVIDRRLDPCSAGLWRWNRWPDRLFEGPMRPIHRSFLDPLPQGRDLACVHGLRLALGDLRHQVMRVLGFDPLDQFALFGMSGNNRVGMSRALPQRRFRQVEAQTRLAHLRIWPVTTEAATGQDRLHVLIEIQMPGGGTAAGEARAQDKGSQNPNKGQLSISIRLVLCLTDVLRLHERHYHSGDL